MTNFKTLSDFKRFNKQQGFHFFENGANRFFNTLFESGLIKGRFFITSEQFDKTFPRQYSVRRANEDGSVTSVPTFQAFDTLADANKYVEETN